VSAVVFTTMLSLMIFYHAVFRVILGWDFGSIQYRTSGPV